MLLTYILIFLLLVPRTSVSRYWTWKCNKFKCTKSRLLPNETPVDANVCNLLCNNYCTIWPQPTGTFEVDREIANLNLDNMTYYGTISKDLDVVLKRFETLLKKDHIKNTDCLVPHAKKAEIRFDIHDLSKRRLQLQHDESYSLHISSSNASVEITIKANNLLGARHGLETLSQVIIFDAISNSYIILKTLTIHDAPKHTIRGVMLDTARNFLHINTIKRIIDGMAMNKLNTFHWHLSDTQSFPFAAKSLSNLSALGAYTEREVYTVEDIQDIVEWARVRGVRIVPEFDGPAHVGEGWQQSGFLVCFNKQPWHMYCKEPPCGQLDPTKKELYATLQLLFRDLIEAFDPDLFHFGGDEVNFKCWKSVRSIAKWMMGRHWREDEEGFAKLWNYYQNSTYEAFMKERRYTIPAIVWSSILTEAENFKYLPKDRYIIHVWHAQRDKTIKHLLDHNYRLIFSNFDVLYLDCGFHSWTGMGNNWCAPFVGWKEIYEHSPRRMVERFTTDARKQKLILGAIAALWTETVGDASAEVRIWPRACALAERVWSEPHTQWNDAEDRLNAHLLRMGSFGIPSDVVVPQWCYLNQGSCHN